MKEVIMKKSSLSLLSGILASCMLLTSCGGSGTTDGGTGTSSDSSAPASSNSTDVTTINYSYWQTNVELYNREYLDIVIAAFEEENPNIKVEVDSASFGDYFIKLENVVTGGGGADVFQMNGVNITKYAQAGILAPLDDVIANSTLDMNNYPEAINEIYNMDGVQYGLPIDFDTIAMWYNKDLFDQAGVEYPTSDWTWEDMVAACEAITALGDGIYGTNANFNEQENFYNTVFSNGGYLVNGDDFGFEDPKTREAVQAWVSLMEDGLSPSQASLQETYPDLQFLAGKLGMYWCGSWMISLLTDPESPVSDHIDVVEIPTFNGDRQSVIHGKANVMSADTEHPEEAALFIQFLSESMANETMANSGIAIPAYLDHAAFLVEKYPDHNVGVYLDAAENYSKPYPSATIDIPWATIVRTELVKAHSLEISVEEACDNIVAQINAEKEALN